MIRNKNRIKKIGWNVYSEIYKGFPFPYVNSETYKEDKLLNAHSIVLSSQFLDKLFWAILHLYVN